jgi:hypothetical protein
MLVSHLKIIYIIYDTDISAVGFQVVDGPLPGALGRVPWGGRQPEGFSPDPYLTGIALGKGIAAMNSAGVIAGKSSFSDVLQYLMFCL